MWRAAGSQTSSVSRGRKEESSELRAANVFVYLFVVAGFGFLLPFVTLSCSGQRLATVTGVQLVTGVEAGSHRSPSDVRAAFALGMCVLGVLLSLKAAGTAGRIPAALAGAAGTVALLFFNTTLEDEALRQGHGVIRVQYEFGYYLALVALASAAAAGFWNPVPAPLLGANASNGGDGGPSNGRGIDEAASRRSG